MDLRTGATRSIPIPAGSGVNALAWSPDLRTVAMAVQPAPSRPDPYASATKGELALLDLGDDTLTMVPTHGHDVVTAAWAPDARELAIQAGRRTIVVDADGSPRREVPVDSGMGLAPRVAWSPDDQWLIIIPYHPSGDPTKSAGSRAAIGTSGGALSLVDATAAGQPWGAGLAYADEILGWRGPGRLVQLGYSSDDYGLGAKLSELSPADGSTRPLAVFEDPHTCEYFLSPCEVQTVQVATAPLSRMEVRSASTLSDRGPDRQRAYLVGAVLVA